MSQTESSKTPVLVIGAGPSGLISALALRKNGISVRLIERRASPYGGIRGTTYQPRIQQIYASLGVLDDIHAWTQGIDRIAAHGSGKEILAVKEFVEYAPESPGTPYRIPIVLSQARLEEVLRNHVEQAGVKIEWGVEFAGLEQNDEKVTVHLKTDGKEVEETFDYVLAADGGHGSTRRALGLSFLGESYTEQVLLTANIETDDIGHDHWHRWGQHGDTVFFLKPIKPAPLFQVQASGPTIPNPPPKDLEGIQALFNKISNSTDIKLRNATWISEWHANIRMTDKFSVGRVFLVGECAHCHSPAGAQGANSGVMDAMNLAWKVALVQKGLAHPSLLKTYEIERLPVIAEMLNRTTELHKTAFGQGASKPVASALTAGAAINPEAAKDPMFRSSANSQLGVNYRWSPLAVDSRESASVGDEKNPYGKIGDKVRAGDRAPDAPGLKEISPSSGSTTSLFELIAGCNKHHIIVFASKDASGGSDILSSFDKYRASGVAATHVILPSGVTPSSFSADIQCFVDEQGHAYGLYDVASEQSVYVVIRPDGMVGAYATKVEDVELYFQKLLSGI